MCSLIKHTRVKKIPSTIPAASSLWKKVDNVDTLCKFATKCAQTLELGALSCSDMRFDATYASTLTRMADISEVSIS